MKVSLDRHIDCLIVVVIITLSADLSLQMKLVYDCLNNGSIRVINPESETLTNAHAYGNGKICNVTFLNGYRILVITDCDGEEPIYIKLYDPGGSGTIIDNVTCKKSPPDQGSNVGHRSNVDVSKTKSILTGIQVQLPDGITIDKSPPKEDDIEMVLRDESGQVVNRHLYVGEAFTWEIAIPTKRTYNLIPVTCNATIDGTSPHSATPSLTFITNGCSLNKDLATHFQVRRESYTRSRATLFAFRFRSSPIVFIHCAVRICQEWNQKCNYTCASMKRSSMDIGKFIIHAQDEVEVSMRLRVIEGFSPYQINRASKAILPLVFRLLLLTKFWTMVE